MSIAQQLIQRANESITLDSNKIQESKVYGDTAKTKHNIDDLKADVSSVLGYSASKSLESFTINNDGRVSINFNNSGVTFSSLKALEKKLGVPILSVGCVADGSKTLFSIMIEKK